MQTKVIHIITKMELGGAQENTLFTVTNLDTARFEPWLITGLDGELFEEARTFSHHRTVAALIRPIRPVQDLHACAALTRIIRDIRSREPKAAPVIVHTHSSKAGILGRWAARRAGVPIAVHTVHGFGFHDYQPWYIRQLYILLERITSRITTAFIAVSQTNIDQGYRLGIFQPGQVHLIRSGIDIGRYTRPADSAGPIAGVPVLDTAPLVTMIACLKPQKNPLGFVDVAARVHRQVPEAHFLLVGDGQLRVQVEHAVREAHLQPVFHLAGWRTDIPAILHRTGVLVLSSRWEGLPRVLPQAMAAGVPVVATAVDGSPEAVWDGATGYLVARDALRDMAEKVVHLLRNPDLARRMGRQATGLVTEFDARTMVRRQEALYDTLLARHRTWQ
jgi:glycosyltransferase involved in cell wall biosynthesis